MTARSPAQIIARINSGLADDFFGTQKSDLIGALPFEDAKPFLKDGVTADQWPTSDIRKEATDYLTFAWDKANDQRGLSAMRSMFHYSAWLWLLGIESVEWLSDYSHYGKPQLVSISIALGVDYTTLDDGNWSSDENHGEIIPPDPDTLKRAIECGEKLRDQLAA